MRKRTAEERAACVERFGYDPEIFERVERDADVRGGYRYSLMREWAPSSAEIPLWPVVMVNPSTADGMEDDPTIERLYHFAAAHGYGGIIVANLFAMISSKPKVLVDLIKLGRAREAIGNENESALDAMMIRAAARGTGTVLAAWGNGTLAKTPAAGAMIYYLDELAQSYELELVALDTCADGWPKHPLARGRGRIDDAARAAQWYPRGVEVDSSARGRV